MDEEDVGSQAEGKLEDDVEFLFKLPLAEFIGARNSLAAKLKRDGRANAANFVKALAKPSVSAWAVNQLHWKHRETFDRLLAAGQRFRQAPTSQAARRVADMRESLDARREALSELSDLATVLLRDAGHNPTPDTIHRITTTLEALSAYSTSSDGPTPGRLTHDVDPPGFETLAGLIQFTGATPRTVTTERNDEPTRVTPSKKSASGATKTKERTSPEVAAREVGRTEDTRRAREAEETRRARIAAAKISLQEARRSLTEARSKAQRLEAAKKKAHAEAKEAETQLREAEERFNKASAAAQEAAHRAQRIAADAEEPLAVDDFYDRD